MTRDPTNMSKGRRFNPRSVSRKLVFEAVVVGILVVDDDLMTWLRFAAAMARLEGAILEGSIV